MTLKLKNHPIRTINCIEYEVFCLSAYPRSMYKLIKTIRSTCIAGK